MIYKNIKLPIIIFFSSILLFNFSLAHSTEKKKKDYNNFIIIITETPINDEKALLAAPVYLSQHKKILGTGTDLDFSFIGLKSTLKLKQKNFPFENTSLEETFIGSFLYASGTNLGFISKSYKEETRFYTNYISQILTLKWKISKYLLTGYGIGSRQYFFIKKETPESFIMPQNHVNIFPRFLLNIGKFTETNKVDQIGSGIIFKYWMGYGFRNKWEEWGEEGDLQSGEYAKDFLIYSATLKTAIKFKSNTNLIFRAKLKGGHDNDFLSRPRFGGTIDNAGLDIVHGFTLDNFRVFEFGLTNIKFAFDINKYIRVNLFLDYAHIVSPERKNIFGSGYGVRILAFNILPIWITHGIGTELNNSKKINQTLMLMSAAGW